jgi:hypothetical protein
MRMGQERPVLVEYPDRVPSERANPSHPHAGRRSQPGNDIEVLKQMSLTLNLGAEVVKVNR